MSKSSTSDEADCSRIRATRSDHGGRMHVSCQSIRSKTFEEDRNGLQTSVLRGQEALRDQHFRSCSIGPYLPNTLKGANRIMIISVPEARTARSKALFSFTTYSQWRKPVQAWTC